MEAKIRCMGRTFLCSKRCRSRVQAYFEGERVKQVRLQCDRLKYGKGDVEGVRRLYEVRVCQGIEFEHVVSTSTEDSEFGYSTKSKTDLR